MAVLSSSSLSLDEPSMSASVARGLTAVVLHQGWSVSKPPPSITLSTEGGSNRPGGRQRGECRGSSGRGIGDLLIFFGYG